MRRGQLAFLIAILVVASLLVIIARSPEQSSGRFPYTSHTASFGSSGLARTGWLMPANTLVSTSYVANRNLSGFVEGIFNVFPYQIEPGTVVRLGLYLNGQLSGTQEHDLTGSYTDQDLSGNYKTPAVMLGGIVNGIANFSFSLLTFTVSTPPGVALAAGTTMTVTVWTSNPVWVQVDKTASVTSFETSGFLSSSLPSTIVANAGAIAPYALSVWFETSAD